MVLINSLALSHMYAEKTVRSGDTVVDATCGKGRDTLFLSNLTGNDGLVYAFDIQEKSILLTKELLKKNNRSNAALIMDGHENMSSYIESGVSCVMFNLGYLPGTDHNIQTNGHTTINAVSQAMKLLRINGIITIVIYQGGDTGFEERDMILDFCAGIDQQSFTVMKTDFTNQKNNPPIFICIEKVK